MATAEEYAAWIVQNKDKKGSPEFETVAQAYKIARQQIDAGAKTEPTLPEKIAADPFARLAVGAAEPLQGAVQRMSEKGFGTAFPMLSFLAKMARPQLDESFAETKKMAKAGGHEGFDAMGMLGNVASPAALGVGKVGIPASLLGKTALGVGAGAGGGTLAPAANSDEARKNAAIGAAFGGVLPGAIAGGTKAATWVADGLIRPMSDLFTKQGPANILNRYIRGDKVVGEKNLPSVISAARNVNQMIPGGRPTVAEAVAGLPEGSPLTALQTISARTGGGPSASFGQRILDQDTAIKGAEAARDAAAAPVRTAALAGAKAGGVKVAPVINTIDKLRNREGYRASDVVTKTLDHLKGKLETLTDDATGVINPSDLYTVRKEIGSTIQKFANENANWDKGLTAKLQRHVQLSMDDAIEKAGGTGWRKYLSDYALASKVIDDFKIRQELAVKRAQPTNLGGGLNIAEETRPHLPNLLSRPAMMLNWAMRKAGGGVEPRVDKALADMMLDPAKFADEMAKLPPQTRIDVEKWLKRSNALTAGVASAQ